MAGKINRSDQRDAPVLHQRQKAKESSPNIQGVAQATLRPGSMLHSTAALLGASRTPWLKRETGWCAPVSVCFEFPERGALELPAKFRRGTGISSKPCAEMRIISCCRRVDGNRQRGSRAGRHGCGKCRMKRRASASSFANVGANLRPPCNDAQQGTGYFLPAVRTGDCCCFGLPRPMHTTHHVWDDVSKAQQKEEVTARRSQGFASPGPIFNWTMTWQH